MRIYRLQLTSSEDLFFMFIKFIIYLMKINVYKCKKNNKSRKPNSMPSLVFQPDHLRSSQGIISGAVQAFRFLNFLFSFPFSPFLIFLLQQLTFYWVCFQSNNRKQTRRCRKQPSFYSEFFTRISEHFRASRLH